MNIQLNFVGDISLVEQGLKILGSKLKVELSCTGKEVKVYRIEKGLSVVKNRDLCEISYCERTDFYRALAILVDAIKENKQINVSEEKEFSTCGAMLDVSRGFVYKKEVIFDLIERMALMGLNMFMLYTEDTYKMDKYPYFGYMRGAYTTEELKEIDNYADIFGIEVIPCIQTLAHLSTYLRWPESAAFRDTSDVLLVGADETYEFIEEMLVTMRNCFRSDRIHIGMDEAFGIGKGRYLAKNGYTLTKDIMSQHLNKVYELCQKYNYHPMIWSDMFFRLSGCTGEYELSATIPENLKKELPKDLEMIYWDYIMEDSSVNDTILKKHFEMERPVGFASGIWTWNRFVCCYKKSYDTSRHQLAACKNNCLSTVFTTIWNNTHSYNSLYSILPALQAYAELCYDIEACEEKIADRFKICTGYDFYDWQALFVDDYSDEDRKKYNQKNCYTVNVSFAHFFNDILIGLLDKSLEGYDFKSKYQKHLDKLNSIDAGDMQDMFDRYKTFAEILCHKSDIGPRIRCAYKNDDKESLDLIIEELNLLLSLYKKFHKQTIDMWYKLCKPFGNNSVDIELGGMESRIETAIYRLNDYIKGEIQSLPELEEEIKIYNNLTKPLIEVSMPHGFTTVF